MLQLVSGVTDLASASSPAGAAGRLFGASCANEQKLGTHLLIGAEVALRSSIMRDQSFFVKATCSLSVSCLLFGAAVLSACSGQVLDGTQSQEPAAPSAADGAAEGLGGQVGQPSPEAHIYASPSRSRLSYDEAVGSLGEGDLTVLMVVDRSGSMATDWDGSTKWDITKASLQQAIIGVEKQVTVGAIFFPLDEECTTPQLSDPRQFQFQRGDLFQQKVAGLAGATGGGTPMMAAFLEADIALQQAIEDGALAGRLRVVVLADGEPNCLSDEELLVSLADSWREAGIEVFVMGLPGTEAARRLLDRIAGKVGEADPTAPPTRTWEEGDQGGGISIAPEDSADVDESLSHAVR